jgi:hypothetical protein
VRSLALSACILAAASLPSIGTEPSAAPPADPTVEDVRSTVAKWIATQDLISKERREWHEGEDLLEAQIEAMEKELAGAEAKLAESRQVLGDLRQKRSDSQAVERGLADSSNRLTEAVTSLEADVRRLHVLLPPAVRDKIAPLYRRLPEDPTAPRVSVGERFQNVIGILNEIQKANGEISLTTEVRTLSDGRPSEVKTVYVGLGQAYFLSARGEAGVGRPGEGGWQWEPADDLAESVAEVIGILESRAQPRFVDLPVTIQ